jgi:hypothetical protein
MIFIILLEMDELHIILRNLILIGENILLENSLFLIKIKSIQVLLNLVRIIPFNMKKILLTGANGMFATDFIKYCSNDFEII